TTTTKIIVDEVSTAGDELNAANEEPVSAAPTNITTAQPSEATKTTIDITTAPKAKGIVFHDVEKSTTRTASSKAQVIDKGKSKLVEEPEALKLKNAQIAIDEEVARRIKAEWNADIKDNIDWNEVVEQEAKELKRNLEIVPDDEDDVFVNVAPLSSKPPTIMDYKIYKEGKKEHFQIIRANGNHQMYLAFSTLLKNFNREDVEKTLYGNFKRDQKVSRVKNWKLFDSCGVYCVTLDTIQLYLLAKKMYPLTNYTLQQMFNEVRLQVDYEVELAYDLLRLVRKQLREGYMS
nr:hypothetical protein [Tanacetum cinerariifolium]